MTGDAPPPSPPPPPPPPPPSGRGPGPGPVPGPGEAYDERTEAVRLKERIYATITMVAVVVALAEDGTVGLLDVVWSIVGTALGVWLATLVADQQAHRVVHHRVARGGDLRLMLYTSGPLLLSAVGPLLFALLSGLGAMSLRTALLTAVGLELAGLFGWGMLGGLRLGAGLLPAVVAGAADLAIGIAIVAVKVAASH